MQMTTGTTGRASRVRVEQGAKRVRAYLGDELVADTIRPRLVWEVPYYPTCYFPVQEVRTDLLVPSATVTQLPQPRRRPALHHQGRRQGGRGRGAAVPRLPDSRAPRPHPAGLGRDGGWFEEDEEVYTHPRDPYTRVDILATSRRVRIELDRVVLAESSGVRVLFETGLPPRWYLPKPDLRMDLLVPTVTATHCPYKGQAQYWSVRLGDRVVEDLAWSYRTPLPESQKIAGLVAFYNERLDLFIDDQLQQRPVIKFSK
jgi:uncharacterized protein (DUF427 family)